MKYSFLYIFTIVLVNYGFSVTTPVSTPLGYLPPMTFLVGVVFVLRDYAQREVGHWVIIYMAIGCLLSYFMASPFVAIASLTAFTASEMLDWAIYSMMKTEFHKRVFYSSFAGVFIDTVIFLPMIGFFSVGAVIIMWISKMIAAAFIYLIYITKVRK